MPAAVLQTYAYLLSDRTTYLPLVSIATSVLTIAYGTTVICFDFDLDPARRVHSPIFYGYIPRSSGSRFAVFLAMFLFTAMHVMLKVLGVALLGVAGASYVLIFLGGDILFFYLQKLLRGDLRIFSRADGVLSWISSLIMRLTSKLLGNFTVMLQLRHPGELGGAYWSTNLLVGQATSFVALYLCKVSNGQEGSAVASARLNFSSLSIAMALLSISSVVFFTLFIRYINDGYIRTFFSTKTAKQFHCQSYLEATTDQARIAVFRKHRSFYKAIRPEVKRWVLENWEEWKEEKPEWFTTKIRKRIEDDGIITKEDKERYDHQRDL